MRMTLRWLISYLLLFSGFLYGESHIVINDHTTSIKSFTMDYAKNTHTLSEINDTKQWHTTSNKITLAPQKSYWYKVSLENTTATPQTRILTFSETNIEYIDVYHQQNSQWIKEASGATVGALEILCQSGSISNTKGLNDGISDRYRDNITTYS